MLDAEEDIFGLNEKAPTQQSGMQADSGMEEDVFNDRLPNQQSGMQADSDMGDNVFFSPAGGFKRPPLSTVEFEEQILNPDLAKSGFTSATEKYTEFTHHNLLSTQEDDRNRIAPQIKELHDNINNLINTNPEVLSNLIKAGDESILRHMREDEGKKEEEPINPEVYDLETRVVIGYLSETIGYKNLAEEGVFKPTKFHEDLSGYIKEKYGSNITSGTLSALVTSLHVGNGHIYERIANPTGWFKKNTLGLMAGAWGNISADGLSFKNISYELVKDVAEVGSYMIPALAGERLIGAGVGFTGRLIQSGVGQVSGAVGTTVLTKGANELADIKLRQEYGEDYKNLKFDEDWSFETLSAEIGTNLAMGMLLGLGVKGVSGLLKTAGFIKDWHTARTSEPAKGDLELIEDFHNTKNDTTFEERVRRAETPAEAETVVEEYAKEKNANSPVSKEMLKRNADRSFIARGWDALNDFASKNTPELLRDKTEDFTPREDVTDTFTTQKEIKDGEIKEVKRPDLNENIQARSEDVQSVIERFGDTNAPDTAQTYIRANYKRFTDSLEVAEKNNISKFQFEDLLSKVSEDEIYDGIVNANPITENGQKIQSMSRRVQQAYEDAFNKNEVERAKKINEENKAKFGEEAILVEPRKVNFPEGTYIKQMWDSSAFSQVMKNGYSVDDIVNDFYDAIDSTKMLEGQFDRTIRDNYGNNYARTRENAKSLGQLLGVKGDTNYDVLNAFAKRVGDVPFSEFADLQSGLVKASKINRFNQDINSKIANIEAIKTGKAQELTELAEIDTPEKYKSTVDKQNAIVKDTKDKIAELEKEAEKFEREANLKLMNLEARKKSVENKAEHEYTKTMESIAYNIKKAEDTLAKTVQTLADTEKAQIRSIEVNKRVTELHDTVDDLKSRLESGRKRVAYYVKKEIRRPSKYSPENFAIFEEQANKTISASQEELRALKLERKDKSYHELSSRRKKLVRAIKVDTNAVERLKNAREDQEFQALERKEKQLFNNRNVSSLNKSYESSLYSAEAKRDKISEVMRKSELKLELLAEMNRMSFAKFQDKKLEMFSRIEERLNKGIEALKQEQAKTITDLTEQNNRIRQNFKGLDIDLLRGKDLDSFRITPAQLNGLERLHFQANNGFTKVDMRDIINDIISPPRGEMDGFSKGDPLSLLGRRIIHLKDASTQLAMLKKYSNNKLNSEILNNSYRGIIRNLARFEVTGIPENGNWADHNAKLKQDLIDNLSVVYGFTDNDRNAPSNWHTRRILNSLETAIDYSTGQLEFSGINNPNPYVLLYHTLFNTSALGGITVPVVVGDTFTRSLWSNTMLGKGFTKTFITNIARLVKGLDLTEEQAGAVGLNLNKEHARSMHFTHIERALDRDSNVSLASKKAVELAKKTAKLFQTLTREASLTRTGEYYARLDVLDFIANNTDFTSNFWLLAEQEGLTRADFEMIQSLATEITPAGKNAKPRKIVRYEDIANVGDVGTRMLQVVEKVVRWQIPQLSIRDRIRLESDQWGNTIIRNLFMFKNVPLREWIDTMDGLKFFLDNEQPMNIAKVMMSSILKSAVETVFRNIGKISATIISWEVLKDILASSSVIGPIAGMFIDLISSDNPKSNSSKLLGEGQVVWDFITKLFTPNQNLATTFLDTLHKFDPTRNTIIGGELIQRLIYDTLIKQFDPRGEEHIARRDQNRRKYGANPLLSGL